MKVAESFLIDQLNQVMENARSNTQLADKLMNDFIRDEMYVNAEGMRVAKSMNEGYIRVIERLLKGLPAFKEGDNSQFLIENK
jgi:enamine deaminase RidA (YjgF/YER057c/UK114 family)